MAYSSRFGAVADVTPDAAIMEGVRHMERMNAFLDRRVLPWPVRFLTHRLVIVATIGMLVPLITLARRTDFVLAVNSYLNVMSVAVSSIVLLYAMIEQVRDRQIAEMQERRAQEDHAHVVEMHRLMLETIRSQHEGIEEVRRSLAEMQGAAFLARAVPDGASVDLKSLHARGAERFASDHVRQRMSRHVANRLGDALSEVIGVSRQSRREEDSAA